MNIVKLSKKLSMLMSLEWTIKAQNLHSSKWLQFNTELVQMNDVWIAHLLKFNNTVHWYMAKLKMKIKERLKGKN